jgi:hypothetical protein
VLASVIIAAVIACVSTSLIAQTFDKPLRKVVRDLGPSRHYLPAEGVRSVLSCFYYGNLLVKEYVDDQMGATWIAVVPHSRTQAPPCVSKHGRDERVISPKEWFGSFIGVAGNWVFLDADENVNGLNFGVYDLQSAKVVFSDIAYDHRDTESSRPDLKVAQLGLKSPVLRYSRVIVADCALAKEGIACWNKVRKTWNIPSEAMPRCTGSVEAFSAIAYPVEVTITPKSVINPLAGSVRCWPAD